jgi:PAS domain S-box-containing protein
MADETYTDKRAEKNGEPKSIARAGMSQKTGSRAARIEPLDEADQWSDISRGFGTFGNFYDRLFQEIRDAILITSPDGRVIGANRAAGALFGCSEDELKAAFLPGGFAAEDRWLREAVAACAGAGGYRGETTAARKDGTRFPAEISAQAFSDDSMNPWISLLITDISERKRSEAITTDALRYNRAVIASCPVGILTCSASGRVISANPAFVRMMGGTLTDMLTRNLFLHPAWKEAGLSGAAAAALSARVESAARIRLASPQGEPAIFDCIFAPFRHGNAWRLLLLATDVTEQVRIEEEVQSVNDRFRLLTESAYEGVLIHDKGVALSMNDQFCVLFGYEHEEILGRNVARLLVAPESREAVERSLASESYSVQEVAGLYRDGTVFPVEIRARSLTGNGRRIQVATVIDLYERKRAGEELRKSHEELRLLADHLNGVREEERSRLARDIHDRLGQTMVALKMNLAALSREVAAANRRMPKKKVVEELKAVQDFIDASSRIIREIISDLRPPLLDEAGLAAALACEADRFTKSSGIACYFNLRDELPGIAPGDSIALFRICQEALTNVVRHANATSVRISLSRKDGGLSLEIADNGRGFRVGSNEGVRSFGLLGMRERALARGGSLTVSAAPAGGTFVSVWLPGDGPQRGGNAA